MSHDHPKHVTPDEHDRPDAWHAHAPEEKPQHAHGEVANAGLIMGVGLLMFAGLVVTVVIVYGYYVWYTTKLLNRQEMTGLEQAAVAYRTESQQNFTDYRWVREDPPVVPKDTVQIPLELAARKVATKYAAPAPR
jgi:hypothetical protein